ncbi:MAG TPA: DUF4062 domain-containing protein [Acidimicrobiia bacterium]|nr:DUF4062 domain-containing protein [Acidimicrobiia bacterium]
MTARVLETTAQVPSPDERLRVFISSTLGELAPEREAAKTAVRTLRLHPIMFELGARPHAPRDLYRAYLEQSDIFVGIYWQSYGWIAPDMAISGLHDEYLLSKDRPRLIYVKEPAPDRQPELEAMLAGIVEEGRVAFKRFEAPGELAELLIDDLAVLISERFSTGTRSNLPEGTMTFLFSDIEGSTRLVSELDGAYLELLSDYHHLVEAAVSAGEGIIVDREGDGVFAAFVNPAGAAEAAVEIQRSLNARRPFGDAVLKARVGLHTGQATATARGYVGLDVHRAARIAAAGHGGQILLSSTAHQLLIDTLVAHHWKARDLGAHNLRGLSRTERIYQLEVPGLQEAFPELRARKTVAARLPVQLTSLVARQEEIAQIASLLSHPQIHLVTITGIGGIGKTRLAVAVAADLADAYPDGIFFVNLATVTESRQVLSTIAEVANISAGPSILDSLADAFNHSKALVVLDNFEQVVAAGADLGSLLQRCPTLDVLVTSREPLRLAGEREYQLQPLEVPASSSLSAVASSAAVKLFEERARAVRPEFEVTSDNAAEIGAIVRRLDGLPLAIELAAARLRLLTPQALAQHLAHSFDILGAGPQDLPARQRTLRSAIDWSYQLLTADEQQAFRRLALLNEGWDLAGGTAVAGKEAERLIESLLDKSLIRVIHDEFGETRFRMLASVREFGQELLTGSAEVEDIVERRNRHYFDVARLASPRLQGPEQGLTMRSLDYDWENLRSTVTALIEGKDFAPMVELVHHLWIYIWLRGHVAESTEWLTAALTGTEQLNDALHAQLLWLVAGGHFEMGDYHRAIELLEQSAALAAAAGAAETLAWARYVRASTLPAFEVDTDELLGELNDVLQRFQNLGSDWGQAWVRTNLAMAASAVGDLDGALRHVQECLRLAEAMNNKSMTAQAYSSMGNIFVARGELAEARQALTRALDIHRTISYREGLAYTLDGLSSLAMGEGDGIRAMTALGAAEGLRRRLGFHPWPAVRWYLEMTRAMADAVTDPDMQAARRAGSDMDPMAAAAFALG